MCIVVVTDAPRRAVKSLWENYYFFIGSLIINVFDVVMFEVTHLISC
jgi:hypothetical protein